MRISTSMQFDSLNVTTNRLENRLMTLSTESSTGLKIDGIEDDPAGSAELVRLGTTEDQTQAYQASIQSVQGDAELSESTLAAATNIFDEAKSVALQGSSGALQASDRAILSKQVDGLYTDLLSLANTKGAHGYLFSGSATQTAPFDATGTFQGNDDARSVAIAQGVSVVANTSGASAFTAAGGTDVFAALTSLKNALDANDSNAVAASVSGLDSAHSQIIAAQSQTGLLLQRLDSTNAMHTQNLTLIEKSKSGIANADLPSVYSQLSQAQTTYTQAVAVNKQVLATLGSWYTA